MKSILITGGTGLIGSRLVKALDKTRYKIYILSRRDQLDRDGIHFIKWNPEKSLLNISKIKNLHSVINLAGASIDGSRWTESYKGKILETCTSNILFFKNREFFSPKNNCYIGNTINYLKSKIKISFKDIYYKDLKKFDEIMLIGSGKGVTPVKYIKQMNWKSKNNFGYKKIIKYLNF